MPPICARSICARIPSSFFCLPYPSDKPKATAFELISAVGFNSIFALPKAGKFNYSQAVASGVTPAENTPAPDQATPKREGENSDEGRPIRTAAERKSRRAQSVRRKTNSRKCGPNANGGQRRKFTQSVWTPRPPGRASTERGPRISLFPLSYFDRSGRRTSGKIRSRPPRTAAS